MSHATDGKILYSRTKKRVGARGLRLCNETSLRFHFTIMNRKFVNISPVPFCPSLKVRTKLEGPVHRSWNFGPEDQTGSKLVQYIGGKLIQNSSLFSPHFA